MDALALLSDDDDGSEQEESKPERDLADDETREAKRRRLETEEKKPEKSEILSFKDLQLAGYTPTELLESSAYLEDAAGQEARKPKLQPAEPVKDEPDTTKEEHVEQGCAAPPRPPPSVTVTGNGHIPAPWTTFDNADGKSLPRELLGPLVVAGFTAPTPIQAQALPLLLAGRDFVGIAQTGSGKTLAYLLPSLARVLSGSTSLAVSQSIRLSWSPSILILAPTRELVCQIENEAARFQKATELVALAVYGGAPKAPQLAGLRARPQIVVATPGRLNDFLLEEQAFCSVHGVVSLIFDEADRMLDDGFEPQIRRIGKEASAAHRQTVMFSATWPASVQKLASDFLRDPVEVRVGIIDELRANSDISQDVLFCDDRDKIQNLVSVLRGRPRARALVFVATKRACKDLARSVRGSVPGRCEAIHGDRRQEEREAALAAFRSGEARILVATDVAGRGLDVQGVSLVVNFDPPMSAEDYVHRIGRTGRAGETGTAISFLTMRDGDATRFIAEVMQRTGVPVPSELKRRVGPALVPDNRQASLTSVMARHEAESDAQLV